MLLYKQFSALSVPPLLLLLLLPLLLLLALALALTNTLADTDGFHGE